jgi:hypothetical protein
MSSSVSAKAAQTESNREERFLFLVLGIRYPHFRLFDFSHAHHAWKRLVNNINNGFFDYRRCATLLLTRLDPLQRCTTASFCGVLAGTLFCSLGYSPLYGFLARRSSCLAAFRFGRRPFPSFNHCNPQWTWMFRPKNSGGLLHRPARLAPLLEWRCIFIHRTREHNPILLRCVQDKGGISTGQAHSRLANKKMPQRFEPGQSYVSKALASVAKTRSVSVCQRSNTSSRAPAVDYRALPSPAVDARCP